MRALELVGFRPEHWHYDYPECYAEFNDKLKEIAISQGKPNSILLGGIVGTGKTAMMAILCRSIFEALMKAAIASGREAIRIEPENYGTENVYPHYFAKRVKYCTHSELANIWSNEFNDASELPSEDYFKKAPVLFLDDLFSAPVNLSGRNTAKLEELIDWRWSNHLKTFIATNISLKDIWKNKQYQRIARRLSEKDWIFYQKLTHKFGGKR